MLISALMLFQNMCISHRTRVIIMPDHRIQPKLHKTRVAHEFLEIAIKGALPFSFDGLLFEACSTFFSSEISGQHVENASKGFLSGEVMCASRASSMITEGGRHVSQR